MELILLHRGRGGDGGTGAAGSGNQDGGNGKKPLQVPTYFIMFTYILFFFGSCLYRWKWWHR